MANPDNQDIEALLIRRLKNGDVDAFASIYKLYFQRLYVYCRQFTKSAYDAEDIVQEVFAKLWGNRFNYCRQYVAWSAVHYRQE